MVEYSPTGNMSPRIWMNADAPRSLKLTGRRRALRPWCANRYRTPAPSDVLAVLSRHGLVSTARKGQVRMLATAFLPRRKQRAQIIALHALKPRGNH